MKRVVVDYRWDKPCIVGCVRIIENKEVILYRKRLMEHGLILQGFTNNRMFKIIQHY
jgi:hypothetical protein